jgi:hypothetical protein
MRVLSSAITTATLAVAVSACVPCTVPSTENEVVFVELGLDADLYAMAQPQYSALHVAAGADGTIVLWAATARESYVERVDIGDADLRAVLIVEDCLQTPSWWVVGDAGTVAVSDNEGSTWSVATLGDADLHAISVVDCRPIVVGDELVLVRQADGSWLEPPTPADGWGSLRGIAFDGTRVHVVGLGGVAWSTSDPYGVWMAEATGVESDLLDLEWVGGDVLVAVGAAGTLLLHDSSGWRMHDSGLSIDLLDTLGGRVLGADGGIYASDFEGALTLEDEYPGALALSYSSDGVSVVGEDGFAATPVRHECE